MATAKRVVLVGAVLYGSWLGMMSVHEAGHVLHARITGGKVSRVAIPLWGFSRTDVTPNPHPLFVAWGGPLWGCLLPTVILGATRVARMPDRRLPLFFAGFCLVANGAYLALGLPARAGDAGGTGCPSRTVNGGDDRPGFTSPSNQSDAGPPRGAAGAVYPA
ncbi:MAG TPA: hypothetical protein PLQ87_03855, partial [Phycisphaerae bacterium]|nr:hypothetical protein [Phycisphaerae bacterium]